MGTIYKVSRPLVEDNKITNAYHDYLLHVQDDGTVRILRGGPAEGASLNSWIFGNIQAVETDYVHKDTPAADIKYSDEWFGAKDWNSDAVNPVTGQWDPNLETRPMEVVYQGADSDFLWGLGADWVLDFDANRNLAYWPYLQNSNSVVTTALINMTLTNPTMDYAPGTIGSPANDVNLDEVSEVGSSAIDHLLFYTDVNPVNVPDGYFYGPDGNLYRIIKNSPNLISFDRSLPGNVGGIDYRIRMKFEMDDGLISNAYSDIIAYDPVDGDQTINSVHATQNPDGSVSFTGESLNHSYNSETGMYEIKVTARPLNFVQEAPPELLWSIQHQNMIFDSAGLFSSLDTSYYGLDDAGLENPLALAHYSLDADGQLFGGFTEINGLEIGLSDQEILSELGFEPPLLSHDDLVSTMESMTSSTDLISQFNDWENQNNGIPLFELETTADPNNWVLNVSNTSGSDTKTVAPDYDETGSLIGFTVKLHKGYFVTVDGDLDGYSEQNQEYIIEEEYRIQSAATEREVKLQKIKEEYRLNNQIMTIGQIGSTFGSAFSPLLGAENQFEQIAGSTVLGLLGKELFKTVGYATIGGKSFGDALDSAFSEFGTDLKDAGIGAISSFLSAELFKGIGLGGVAGEIGQSLTSNALNALITNIETIKTAEQFKNVLGGVFEEKNIVTLVGGVIGSKLADLVYKPDTVGGQIGGSIGAGLSGIQSAIIYPQILALAGGNPVLAAAIIAIRMFFDKVIGSLIGSLFGGTPRSAADVVFNHETQEFGVSNAWSRKGHTTETAEQMASFVAVKLNGILEVVGGTVINEGRVSGGTYGTRKSDFTYRVDGGAYGPGDPGKQTISKIFEGKEDPIQAMNLLAEHGIVNALSNLQIAGGDVFLKRALYGSLDAVMTGGNIDGSIAGEAMNVINGNFMIAAKYKYYIENAAAINATMLGSNDLVAGTVSAFSAGWMITLQRAVELGLNKRHASDWLGGYNAWAVTNDVQSFGGLSFSDTNPYTGVNDGRYMLLIDENGHTRRIFDTVVQADKDVISGTNNGDIITITDDLLTGNALFTINDEVSDGSNFTIDIAATVHGGDGDDVISGGDLGNDLYGDAGNDTITGGTKDDWIFGGLGNDKLYAGGGSGNFLSGDAGDDELYGATGSDWLDGGSGIDTLYGNAGGDILTGGAGEGDQLFGGSGDDSYILNLGDGADIIDDKADVAAPPTQSIKEIVDARTDGIMARNWAGIDQQTYSQSSSVENGKVSGGHDTLILGQGIGVGDVTITRSEAGGGMPGNDLIVKVHIAGVDTGDQVTLTNWFNDYQRIEKLQFADGQTINIGNFATFTMGTDGADYIIGTAGNDFAHGGSGNDVMSLLWGDDVAIGGLGDDFVSGDPGKDIVIGGDNNDIVIGGDGDDIVSGGRHEDSVYGGSGNDILAGEEGDDFIVGGADDDVFKYSRGDGKDVIIDEWSLQYETIWRKYTPEEMVNAPEGQNGEFLPSFTQNETTKVIVDQYGTVIFDGTSWAIKVFYDSADGILKRHQNDNVTDTTDAGEDTIEFGVGIDINDIQMKRDGIDLILGIEGYGQNPSQFDDISDQIRLKEWNRDWGAAGKPIETFSFFSTGKLNTAEIDVWGGGGTDGNDTIVGALNKDWLTGNGGNDTIDGMTGDDIINGNSGQDTLIGGGGDDILLGGSGNDILRGDDGEDILVGGEGNDIISYEGASAAVNVSLDGFVASAGEAVNDEFYGIEGIQGTDHNDTLGGDKNANHLEGGLGNDTLYGQLGDDSYVFNRGDGDDQIFEYQHTTEIVVDAEGNLHPAYQADWDLVSTDGFEFHGQSVLFNYLLTIKNEAGDIVYSHNLVTAQYGVVPKQLPLEGWVVGFAQTNNGQEVTRTLTGSQDGGDDVLEFGEDISLSNLSFAITGNDLVITVDNGGGSITIDNFQQDYARIETLQFSDGLTVDLATINIDPGVVSTSYNGIQLDGVDDYVRVDGSGEKAHLAGSFTIEAEFIWDGSAQTNTLLAKDNSYGILIQPDGSILFALYETGVGYIYGDTGVDVVAGEVTNIALTYDKATREVFFYLDGQQIVSTLPLGPIALNQSTNDLLLGNLDTYLTLANTYKFNGDILGVRLWNTALGVNEIGAESVNGSHPNNADLLLDLDFEANDLVGGSYFDNTGTFTATPANEAVILSASNDFLVGDALDNTLTGYEGNDVLSGGAGNDTLNGGGDDDVLEGGLGGDALDGGDGVDTVRYNGSASAITVDLATNLTAGTAATGGEAQGDTFASIENVFGSAFDDKISGDASDNQLFGLTGDDTLSGAAGDDVLKGDEGSDSLHGDDGEDNLFGDTGNDTLVGGLGKDSLYGGDGDDILYAGEVKLGDGLLMSGSTSSGFMASDIPSMPTDDFTIEIEFNPTDVSGWRPVFSYASTKNANDILVWNFNDLQVWVGGTYISTGISLAANQTHRLTVSFTSSEGRLKVYDNGALLYNNANSALIGYQIGQNGTLVLGQEQDAIGGGFDGTQTFIGEYYRAQVWDSVLSDTEVQAGSGTSTGSIVDFNFVQTTPTESMAVIDQAGNIVGQLLSSTTWLNAGGAVQADTESNLLAGGEGNDQLFGSDGADQIIGGVGNDTLQGGLGDDLYLFGLNEGQDTIIDASGVNEIAFDPSEVTYDQLWFTRSNDDLIIEVVGGDTKVTLQNYYTGGTALGRIVTVSHSLSGDQVDDLVVAMDGNAIGTVSEAISEARSKIWQDNLFYVDRYIINGTSSADTLSADARVGDYYISGFGGDDTLTGGAGNDILDGGTGGDYVYGEGGDDTFLVDGTSNYYDRFYGGTGFDTILGGDGDDFVTIKELQDIERIDGGAGYNVLSTTTWSSSELLDLRGIEVVNIDLIKGRGYKDTIYGSSGNDVINGGGGGDHLYGEGGDDTFITEGVYGGWNHFYGGTGFDTIVGSDSDDTISIYKLQDVERIDGGAGYNVLSTSTYSVNELLDLRGMEVVNIDKIVGRGYTDTIYGSSGDDLIDGAGYSDNLYGEDGDDTLIGGTGNDKLYGGLGSDTVDLSQDSTTESVSVDLTINKVTWSGGAIDTLDSIENIIGSVNGDTITGDINNNILDGHAGDDILVGGGGDDTLIGGAGIDSFDGGVGSDTVDYSARTISLTISITGGVNIDGTTETFTSIENLKGGLASDIIIGDSDDNRLDGHLGNDTIQGGLGNDILIGGEGNDSLDGGSGLLDVAQFTGNQSDYTIDTVNGRVIDNNLADGDEGTDTISNIEILRFADGDISLGIDPNNAPEIGDHQALPDHTTKVTKEYGFTVPANAFIDQDGDTLTYSATLADGSALPVWLAFDPASRTFSGTPGEAIVDTNLTIRIKVTDGNGGEKYDDFVLSLIPAGVTINGTANDDMLVAGDGDDKLYGLAGNDTLSGLTGEDLLDGGTGFDTADYSASNAVVTVDLLNGTATGGHAEGDSFVSIENLKGSDLVGSDTLKGDDNANVIEGLSGNDVLFGRGGNDILHGDWGDDTLWGDDGNDTLYGESGLNALHGGLGDDIFISGSGQDSMFGDGGSDTVDYSSSGNAIQIDLISGTTAGGYAGNDTLSGIENIIGTDFDDQLAGDGSSNHLQTGNGNDILDGRAGADILDGGSGIDTVSYANSASAVTVDLSGTLANSGGDAAGDTLLNIENIIGSAGNDEIHGNGIDNRLEGGAGNDKIYGSDGQDYISGDDGDDELYGGNGKDTLYGGNGNDRIEAGSEGDHLNGGADDDYLIGGVGDDTYHVGRNTGHDIIDNYDTTPAIDRIAYYSNPLDANDPLNVSYLNLWFERGEYDPGTGIFTRDDASGTDLRITVLDSNSSTTVLDMFDVNGTILKNYSVDMVIAGERKVHDDVDINALLAIMQPEVTIPTGSAEVPLAITQQVDTAWGFNSAPAIALTTVGIDPADVHIAEGSTLELTFDVSDIDDPDGSLVVTAHRMTSNAEGDDLFADVIIENTIVDDNIRTINITPIGNLSGNEEIRIQVSDGGLATPLVFNVTVDPVAQVPDLTVPASLATNEATAIALDITASSNDTDGSEDITVEISGVPAGGILSAGTENAGVWTVTEAQLIGLTLTPPAGSGNDISLSVVAKATDGASVTPSPAQILDIDVNGKPTDISLSNTDINEEVFGDVVGTLSTTDIGETGPYTYSIVGGVDSGNFVIDYDPVSKISKLKLKPSVSLDFENVNDKVQEVKIRTTDPGGLYVDKTFSLGVTDLNEKPSQPTSASTIISENGALSVTIGGAVDPEGNDVDYSFVLVGGASGNTGGLFKIVNDGSNSASLMRADGQELDFEFLKNQGYFHLNNANQGYLDVTFVATDLDVTDPNINFDDLRKSGQQTVRVTVNDVNDNAPNTPTLLTQHATSRNENVPSGIGVKVATLTNNGDADGETPILRVKPGTPEATYFEIKPGTNELWIKANTDFNYETYGGIKNIQVEAWDGLHASPTSETISFTINNVNETFTLAETITFSGVDESTVGGTPVGSVTATDNNVADEDGLNDFQYTFVGGADLAGGIYNVSSDNLFRINKSSGAITLNGDNTESYLDYETSTQHIYSVMVKDNYGGAGANQDPITVTIPVLNKNEAPDIEIANSYVSDGVTNNHKATYAIDPEGHAVTSAVVYSIKDLAGNEVMTNFGSSLASIIEVEIIYQSSASGEIPAGGYHIKFTIPQFAGPNPGDYKIDLEVKDSTGATFRKTNTGYIHETPWTSGGFPVALDLDGDGVELISIDISKVKMDVDGDGHKNKLGWISGDDGWLALDRNGSGTIDAFNEISFIKDTPGATTDLEGLNVYDTNGNGLLDQQDERFGEFLVWQDANENGVSDEGELKTLDEVGIRALELTPTLTGDTVEGAPDNVITGTSRYLTTDGQFGEVGDVALAFIDKNNKKQHTGGKGNNSGHDVLTPIVFDLKDDGLNLHNYWESTVYFDVDSDGDRERTGWVGADDAMLTLDRNNNGLIDNGSEISFSGDVEGATTDLEGLAAFDTNEDGVLDALDDRYADFLVWQDENQNGISEESELKSLLEMDIVSINLEPSTTGNTINNTEGNIVFNSSEYTRSNGSTAAIGDVGLRFDNDDFIEGTEPEAHDDDVTLNEQPKTQAVIMHKQLPNEFEALEFEALEFERWEGRKHFRHYGMYKKVVSFTQGSKSLQTSAVTSPTLDDADILSFQEMFRDRFFWHGYSMSGKRMFDSLGSFDWAKAIEEVQLSKEVETPKSVAGFVESEMNIHNLIQAMNSFDITGPGEMDRSKWENVGHNGLGMLAFSSH